MLNLSESQQVYKVCICKIKAKQLFVFVCLFFFVVHTKAVACHTVCYVTPQAYD